MSDIIERLNGYNVKLLIDLIDDAEAEIKRLRGALGMCPVSSTGKHVWAIFPTGQDDRIYQGPHPESGGAGAFCQLCQIPKSPYHEA
jgi:hypothetical protein